MNSEEALVRNIKSLIFLCNQPDRILKLEDFKSNYSLVLEGIKIHYQNSGREYFKEKLKELPVIYDAEIEALIDKEKSDDSIKLFGWLGIIRWMTKTISWKGRNLSNLDKKFNTTINILENVHHVLKHPDLLDMIEHSKTSKA
jgi:hypothetical protein